MSRLNTVRRAAADPRPPRALPNTVFKDSQHACFAIRPHGPDSAI